MNCRSNCSGLWGFSFFRIEREAKRKLKKIDVVLSLFSHTSLISTLSLNLLLHFYTFLVRDWKKPWNTKKTTEHPIGKHWVFTLFCLRVHLETGQKLDAHLWTAELPQPALTPCIHFHLWDCSYGIFLCHGFITLEAFKLPNHKLGLRKNNLILLIK